MKVESKWISGKCAVARSTRDQALQFLVEVLDDDEAEGRGGLIRAAGWFDHLEALTVGRNVVCPAGVCSRDGDIAFLEQCFVSRAR